MKAYNANWKKMAMVAVLGAVVYQGLLVTTRFEVGQKLRKLDCKAGWSQDIGMSYRDYDNAAPLYEAAARMQDAGKRTAAQQVNLEYYRQQREAADRQLSGGQLALDLLRRAGQARSCTFSYDQLRGEFPFHGYRSLVQAACLQMMRLAEGGQIQDANVVARDVVRLISRFEESPTVLHHAVSLKLTEQLASTIQELHAAYPGQGFEQLAADLDGLSSSLDRGFAECPAFERQLVVSELERVWEGQNDGEGLLPDGLHVGLDLQLAQAELAYLEGSERIESAFRAGDDQQVAEVVQEMEGGNALAGALTPNWTRVAGNHREVLRELRPSR